MDHVSLWSLKKMPMDTVVDYILSHGSKELQARMAEVSVMEFDRANRRQAKEWIAGRIAKMNEEEYTDYLLEIIDE